MRPSAGRRRGAAGRGDEILRAADRAAALTRQLLAFSRKQVLQPTLIDLNEIVVLSVVAHGASPDGLADSRRRATRHRAAQVLADPATLEQVLLNLVVNARDAMPAGGLIRITTDTAVLEAGSPGDARRPVWNRAPTSGCPCSDNGVGMDQATQARIFEPFFTTKEPGRGTGLGLSTVYGILRQTGGAITVTSAPQQGATFVVYLPAVTGVSP